MEWEKGGRRDYGRWNERKKVEEEMERKEDRGREERSDRVDGRRD